MKRFKRLNAISIDTNVSFKIIEDSIGSYIQLRVMNDKNEDLLSVINLSEDNLKEMINRYNSK